MMKKSIEILELASRLISRGWTRKAFARNQAGDEVVIGSQDAVYFCAKGAICRAAKILNYGIFSYARAENALRFIVKRNLILWNDNTSSVQEVLVGFESAINLLKVNHEHGTIT